MLQSKKAGRGVRPAFAFSLSFSDRRVPTPPRFGSVADRGPLWGRANRHWSCGNPESPAPAHATSFGPYRAPQPRQSGRSTPRARPNRELSGLSFASSISLLSAFCVRTSALRFPHRDLSCGLLRCRPSRSGEQICWSKNFSTKYSADDYRAALWTSFD